jgi:hypothetical protein
LTKNLGGNFGKLLPTSGLALWWREVGAIGFLFAVVLWFQLGIYLSGFSFYHQHYIINLASAAGTGAFQILPQRQAVNVNGNNMKSPLFLLFIFFVTLLSCNNQQDSKTSIVADSTSESTTISLQSNADTGIAATATKSDSIATGVKVQGDFDGDGIQEWAMVVQTTRRQGNPVEDGTAGEYAIKFSDNKFHSFSIGCCETMLINEGDLIGDKKDKLSTFQSPMNGNAYTMTTYALVNGRWRKAIEPFLISNGGDPIRQRVVKGLVFSEGKTVYIHEQGVNSEADTLTFIKTPVNLKLK